MGPEGNKGCEVSFCKTDNTRTELFRPVIEEKINEKKDAELSLTKILIERK